MVGRAFALLAAFGPGEHELSLAELSRRTRLATTTVHRLVHELEALGAVERAGRGVRLGLRLFELGQLAPRHRDLEVAAAPFLAALHRTTGETVHLAVLDRTEVVYLQKITAARGPDAPSRPGGRMPAACTGLGKALLAFGAPGVAEAALRGPLHRRTPRTVTAPGLLRAQLDRVRRTGLAHEHEESAAGIACVAAPVLGPDGRALAALSLTGRAGRPDAARSAPAVRAAALGASRALRRLTPP